MNMLLSYYALVAVGTARSALAVGADLPVVDLGYEIHRAIAFNVSAQKDEVNIFVDEYTYRRQRTQGITIISPTFVTASRRWAVCVGLHPNLLSNANLPIAVVIAVAQL